MAPARVHGSTASGGRRVARVDVRASTRLLDVDACSNDQHAVELERDRNADAQPITDAFAGAAPDLFTLDRARESRGAGTRPVLRGR